MSGDRLEALRRWRRQLWRCAFVVVILLLVLPVLWRPSVPPNSRLGWLVFFGILALAAIGSAWRARRALGQTLR